jgi:hypothetical protein
MKDKKLLYVITLTISVFIISALIVLKIFIDTHGSVAGISTQDVSATSTLNFSSASSTYTGIGTQFDVDLELSTNGNSVNVVQYSIEYDNTALDIVSVTDLWSPANANKNITTSNINSYAGTSFYKSLFSNVAITGNNIKLATITFSIKAGTNKNVTFTWKGNNSDDGIFASDGLGTNVHNASGDNTLTLTLSESSVTPTPTSATTSTPIPTVSPTASPTPGPSVIPTTSPTLTIAHTPTPTSTVTTTQTTTIPTTTLTPVPTTTTITSIPTITTSTTPVTTKTNLQQQKEATKNTDSFNYLFILVPTITLIAVGGGLFYIFHFKKGKH